MRSITEEDGRRIEYTKKRDINQPVVTTALDPIRVRNNASMSVWNNLILIKVWGFPPA
jgi:hypothetical protein